MNTAEPLQLAATFVPRKRPAVLSCDRQVTAAFTSKATYFSPDHKEVAVE